MNELRAALSLDADPEPGHIREDYHATMLRFQAVCADRKLPFMFELARLMRAYLGDDPDGRIITRDRRRYGRRIRVRNESTGRIYGSVREAADRAGVGYGSFFISMDNGLPIDGVTYRRVREESGTTAEALP